MFDLDFDLDFDDSLLEQSSEDERLEVIPLVLKYTDTDGNIKETKVYVTDSIDLALYFNKDLDEFSSYEYFLLPEGLEIRNYKLLDSMDKQEIYQATPTEIKESRLLNFDNLFIRSQLLNVYRK